MNITYAVEVNMLERMREIDPQGLLSTCEDVLEMVNDNLLTSDMVTSINEALDDWSEADPDGYDSDAAAQLDDDIAYIIHETI